MTQLLRQLRLPSTPAPALYAATVLIKGDNPVDAEGLVELGLIPTAWAIFALVTPLGGRWWWSQNLGGREPSERERTAYQDAVELLLAHATGPVRLPNLWFVVDIPQPDASVCGETLMISRGMLERDFLPAVLAHELGRLNTSDGKLTAAINRLIIIARGGLALRLLTSFWGSYWREREYIADQYAATLGQADELADFLEVHALIHDHPVPLIWLTEHTHPPTELRVDKLRKTGAVAHLVAAGSEPVKAAPTGPPAAGPDGPTLTEPNPSAGRAIRSAGKNLPTFGGQDQ